MTTKPKAKNSGRLSQPAHIFRCKALHLAVASCFAVAPAYAVTLADYNYATKAAGMVTSDTMSGSTRTIANINGAILNWSGLNINAGETLKFQQLNAASKVLNRVGGGNMTSIMGTLSSNGQVFLINNAGIAIGKGATINVAGFVASSLNITDADFIAGRNRFNADVAHPGNVSNAGTIITPSGGFVYLLAPQVENSGIITTPSGEAILAAGNSVELVDSADPSLRVRVSARSADVNLSQMMTQSNGDIFSVLNSGKVSANTAVVGQNGKVQFRSAGNLQTTATSVVEAKGDANTDGGLIRGFANGVGTYAGSFDVSGKNGGKIETSAAYLHLDPNIKISAAALSPTGHGGSWLLDPYDFDIGASEASSISTALASGNSVTIDTGDGFSGMYSTYPGSVNNGVGPGNSGNIRLLASSGGINAGSGSASFTMDADGSVTIDAPITGSALSLHILADRDNNGNGGIAFNSSVNIGGAFSASTLSGNITMSGHSNIIQASNVDLEAYGGDIGSLANMIRTDTPILTVGGSSTPSNAFVSDDQAVISANFHVLDTALLVLGNGMAYGGNIMMTAANGFVASTGNLSIAGYGGHISFNGNGRVDVNGDLSMSSHTYISSTGDLTVTPVNLFMDNAGIHAGGNLTVAADNNITMINHSIMYGGSMYGGSTKVSANSINMTNSAMFSYGGDLNVSGNSISMDNSALIAFYGGDLNVSANTIDMTNNSVMSTSYGGNISIGNAAGSALGAASLTMDHSRIYGGDILILAQHVGLTNSSIDGFDIGINFFPGDVAGLTATDATTTAALAFFQNASVDVGDHSSISASHALGVRTGNLTVDASNGFASLDASTGSMALLAAGSITLKGGNGFAYGGISASQDLFLKVGKQLTLQTSSDGTGHAAINVGSEDTLIMGFPLITKNGWNVDGVDNAFTSTINPSTGIFVDNEPAKLNVNTFVKYGGVTQDAGLKSNLSLQASELLQSTGLGATVLSDSDRANQIFGNGSEEEKDEKDKDNKDNKDGKNKKEIPKQCS